jgi:N-acetylneuraminic acid mutarotase
VTLTSGSYTSTASTLSSGSATINIPAGSLATGSDTLTVSYTPDSSSSSTYNSASGSASVIVTTPANTTPMVTATPSATSITTAQSLKVTVTVNGGTGNPTPTGSVTLTGGGYTSSATTLSGGSATFNVSAGSLALGYDTLSVTYTPDPNSSSTYLSVTGASAVLVTLPVTAAPVFTPGAGAYASAQSVTISDATPGATIFYTTNGTTPTTNSAVYSGGIITVSSSETLEAIATHSGYTVSAAASANYLISPLAVGGRLDWTWMGGSQTAGAVGVYGTQGVPAAGNIPGARLGGFTWTDASGNLWLFGGQQSNPGGGAGGGFNDLWEFNPSTNIWTWAGGSNTVNAAAVYGTQGVSSTSNIPGPRNSGVTWTDKSGNLWLFGGNGYDSTGKQGFLNDLWEYSPSTQEWTWVGGSKTSNSTGSFGTQGVASASNVPSAREGEDSGGVLPGWTDNDGNFWLFGGDGQDSTGTTGALNDLWEYSPASNIWTWVSGSKTENGSGVYGTQGVAGAGNTPSARQGAQAWKDNNGNFWLHGGWANDVNCPGNTINMCTDSPEMWEFNPLTKEWMWISGQDSQNTVPVYGTQGVASITSNPSGREMAATWTDTQGNLWLFSGYAFDGQNNNGPDDLWMYNTTTNQWTWVGGGDQPNVFGTLGVPAATNWPNSRGIEGPAMTWVDAQGKFWLFGGNADGAQNDLWVYQPPTMTPTITVTPASSSITTAQAPSVTIAVSGTPTPTGSVTLSSDIYTSAATSLNSGSAQIIIPAGSLAVGSDALTANYSPDSNSSSIYTSATGTSIRVTVSKATPSMTVTPGSSSITTAQALSVAVGVGGGSGAPVATGSLTLTSGGYTSAATALVSGSATINIPAGSLAVGSDTLTASYSGDSNYNANTGTAPVTITTAVNPNFTVSGTAVTVSRGATTGNTSVVTLTPTGGFTGSIALTGTVTSSPSGAQYLPTLSFGSTSPVSISGTTAGTATLTISTTAATSATLAYPKRPAVPWYTAGGATLACLLLLGIPGRLRRWQTMIGMLLLLVALSGGAAACGSGGNSGGGGGGGTSISGTTSGAYTITVTGTSGSTTNTGTITLTVQ